MNNRNEMPSIPVDDFVFVDIISVSYTHLDVYKRQIHVSNTKDSTHFVKYGNAWFSKISLPVGYSFIAVSYTHLDVYKRQIMLFSPIHLSHWCWCPDWCC